MFPQQVLLVSHNSNEGFKNQLMLFRDLMKLLYILLHSGQSNLLTSSNILRDICVLQQSFRRIKFSGIRCSVIGCVVPNTLKAQQS